MNNVDKQVLDLYDYILKHGEVRSDRTGTGTLSIFDYTMRFDMSEGFPLLTTKHVAFRLVAEELLWFLKGDTNLKTLIDKNVNIWTPDGYRWYKELGGTLSKEEFIEFVKENGFDLGRIYGGIWTDLPYPDRVIEKVNPIIKEQTLNRENNVKVNITGKTIYTSEKFGDYIIIGDGESYKYKGRERKTVNIQFLDTGFIQKNVRIDAAKEGRVRDVYKKTVAGIGYSGEYEVKTKMDKHLKKVWNHMIDRCYNQKCKEYKYYGGKGVFVEDSWHNFSNFVKDVKRLVNWKRKEREPNKYQLDKDYYSSNCYSPDTCVWISKSDNMLYRNSRLFKVTTPEGCEYKYISITKCANDLGLLDSKISMVLSGKRKHHKGFTFEYLPDGELYRYKLPLNQIHKVIEDIKSNPTSRRLYVDAWSPTEQYDASLPCCHNAFQLYVHNNGKLDLKFFMRSNDSFLGLPFNIASYGLLLHLIALECGLEVGSLIYNGGDIHLYLNHIEQAKEQLLNEPRKLPKLVIKNKKDNLEDYEIEDFEIVDYNPHKAIKAPVSVGLKEEAK